MTERKKYTIKFTSTVGDFNIPFPILDRRDTDH